MLFGRILFFVFLCVGSSGFAHGAIIQVTPKDNYRKIESANPGDIVEIAPGTYKFRVMLVKKGTAANPIIIRAKDPKNRPVWDLKGKRVSQWPGSYTGGDRGRGCWQIRGSHYVISGIVFRNCQDSSSAGIRAINSGPLTVRDCLFANNTNGLTGSSEKFVVEFCEFAKNGKVGVGGAPTHNIYIYGGVFELRYSYLHDPLEGQNFHVRARDSIIEYNWMTRPGSYPGDIMSCGSQCGAATGIVQKMLLRGNVIIQGSPRNQSQLIALYNDSGGSGKHARMELKLISNTIIGTARKPGQSHNLVNMRNDGVATHIEVTNNIIYQVGNIAAVRSPGKSNWSIKGTNNYVTQGTKLQGLLKSITSGVAFQNPGAKDYRLKANSSCRKAAVSHAMAPNKEYYLNETTKLQYRQRLAAKDLGAFEYGTSTPPIGPYKKAPPRPEQPKPEQPAKEPPSPDSGPNPPDAGNPTPDKTTTPDQNTSPDNTTAPDNPTAPDNTAATDNAAAPDTIVTPEATVTVETGTGQEQSAPQDSPGTGDTASPQDSGNTSGGCSCQASHSATPVWWGLLLFCLFILRRKVWQGNR